MGKNTKSNLIKYIKALYNAWDSATGKFLNGLAVISAILFALIQIRIITFKNDALQIIFTYLTLAYAIIIWIIAHYKVWNDQEKKILVTTEKLLSKKTNFNIEANLIKLSSEKYIKVIDERIQDFVEKEKTAPKSFSSPFNIPNFLGPKILTKHDYHTYTELLKTYKLDIDGWDTNSKIYKLDLKISADKTDDNIDITAEIIEGAMYMENSYITDFPRYPITQEKLFPYINSPQLSNFKTDFSDIKYRTNIEINSNVASCNIKYIKAGQPATFMNSLLVKIDGDCRLRVSINSNKSGETFTKTVKVTNHPSNTVDIMTLYSFRYISGDEFLPDND